MVPTSSRGARTAPSRVSLLLPTLLVSTLLTYLRTYLRPPKPRRYRPIHRRALVIAVCVLCYRLALLPVLRSFLFLSCSAPPRHFIRQPRWPACIQRPSAGSSNKFVPPLSTSRPFPRPRPSSSSVARLRLDVNPDSPSVRSGGLSHLRTSHAPIIGSTRESISSFQISAIPR